MNLSEVRRNTPKEHVIKALKDKNACREAIRWAKGTTAKTAQGLWNSCPRGIWMEWLCRQIGDKETALALSLWVDAYMAKMLSEEDVEKQIANAIRREWESPWL